MFGNDRTGGRPKMAIEGTIITKTKRRKEALSFRMKEHCDWCFTLSLLSPNDGTLGSPDGGRVLTSRGLI